MRIYVAGDHRQAHLAAMIHRRPTKRDQIVALQNELEMLRDYVDELRDDMEATVRAYKDEATRTAINAFEKLLTDVALRNNRLMDALSEQTLQQFITDPNRR
jgi:predicted amidohydrolase YtcJ